MTTPKIPMLKLNNGNEIPAFGLGTWKSKTGEVAQSVKDAIDVGYRHIDAALCYQNEKEVGEAITAKIKEGVVKREDLFVTSKLWNTFHRPDLVKVGLQKSLDDLGLKYLDMYLIHWPMAYKETGDIFPKDANDQFIFSEVDYLDTWKALEECVKLGLIKSIGVSNFNSEQIQRIWDNSTIKPSNVQVECHPYWNQLKIHEFCKAKGIILTGYSPLGSPDRPWAKPTDPKLLDDPKLVELAKKYKKSSAQIVLRWLVQRGIVAIPKTVNKNRLVENMNVFDFKLTDEDMNYIFGLQQPAGRNVHLSWVNHHKYYPFHAEF